jgi:SAM-dependent MidA family methyltransferase
MFFSDRLRLKIHESGPIPFSNYMEEVVQYYYSSSRNPIGMSGDFYTSADLDPIFGQLLARQFQEWSAAFETFTVVELGAGKGLLARDILECRRFPYIILERSPAMRRRQQELLQDYDITWVDEIPGGVTGCIFSNEFFDALPVHRVVCRGGVLREIYVTEDFEETLGPLDPAIGGIPALKENQIVDISVEARGWIRRIGNALRHGYHLAIDYGYLREEFYAQPRGTLMCYWQHQAVENPYVRVGEQDITAHVNFSDLMGEPTLQTVMFATQKDYLIQRGILTELERLASAGDAVSMQRLLRMKKLILPSAMGERFKVLVQTKK